MILMTIVIALNLFSPISCWHLFEGKHFHCWPLTASATNDIPINCPGVHIGWIDPPPKLIKAEKPFNVSFFLRMDFEFYDWMVKNNYFSFLPDITTGAEAQAFCETSTCFINTKTNCCIHHVNVHTCPLESDVVKNGLCGPWIPKSGQIITHSKVLYGNAKHVNWTSVLPGLYRVGTASMIAHFKVAGIHIATEARLTVLPRSECGNGICENEDGEICDTCPKDCGDCPLKPWQISLIAGAVVLLPGIVLVSGIMLWRRHSKLFWDNSWIFLPEDLKEEPCPKNFNSRMSMKGFDGEDPIIQIVTVKLNGKQAVVKSIIDREIAITKSIRREIKAIRVLDHRNINPFVGFCVESQQFLMEYCPKESLKDVLIKSELKLNWPFRLSLVTDVASGMAYLHENKFIHGHLTSLNCVVDDRWTCKITDYGPDVFFYQSKQEKYKNVIEKTTNRPYIPPEALTNRFDLDPPPSWDVYAFGVILIEVARMKDLSEEKRPPPIQENPNWFPVLPTEEDFVANDDSLVPDYMQYLKLIGRCRQPEELRPSFDVIRKQLMVINPNKLNAFDQMMNLMKDYSKYLESVVEERTKDLVIEKQKTDNLLYSMLPRSVADQLRIGVTPKPLSHDSSSIYFSDIVGFTSIASMSTPMEIVNLLNCLYTQFDDIIDAFDVYKVETIGDAYMVASGVPAENGNRHAVEITSLAIALVKCSKNFIMPHIPREPLKIRVGIHSGPVCSGVVGTRMPRYCLFGDTVNTASRMESNGEAYKIHISDSTHEILRAMGADFHFELRGTIAIKPPTCLYGGIVVLFEQLDDLIFWKVLGSNIDRYRMPSGMGKGEMKTWWVTGRNNYKLPSIQESTLPGYCGE